MNFKIDINEEFLIMPHQNGMQIITPEASNKNKAIPIKEVLKLPMNVYFQIPGGTILNCNEQVFLSLCGSSCGFNSHYDLIGINADKICKLEYVEKVREDDHKVIQSSQLMLFEEDLLPLKDDINIPMLSFKFPCYSSPNQQSIIFGLSILYDNTLSPTSVSLAEGVSILLKTGIFTSNSVANGCYTMISIRKIEDVHITFQQERCLQFAIKGMTAKKIAKKLGISPRTVERHFEILKHKLKVKSKSELIEKIVNYQSKIQ
jgi:DNA-binding CsgD family transcriptional regulator